MTFSSFLIIAGCVAVGYWVVSSVISDDSDRSDRDADAAPRPAPAARPATRPLSRALPRSTPRPAAQPAVRTASRPASQPVAKRAVSRPRTAPRSEDPMSSWNVVLDVSEDAPRIEILAAVKRRLSQARADGDTAAMARITRAAQQGLGLRSKR